MDIRSFFKRKDPTTADVASKGLPATPLLKNEDAKRKNDTLSSGITNASRQKKVRSSPEAISRGENTCVGSSKEARSRLSQQGNTDADLDELLEDAVTSSSLSKSNAQGLVSNWSWENRGTMLPFDLAAAKLLESEFSKFKAGGPSVITLPLGTGEYDVDFAVMEQINRKTKFRRAIKREGAQQKADKPASTDLDAFRHAKADGGSAARKAMIESHAQSSVPLQQNDFKQGSPTPVPRKDSSKKSTKSGAGGGGGFWNREPPPLAGMKVIPRGAPNCLRGKAFLISGTMESLERDEAEALIKKYGGEIRKSVPKKLSLDYAIMGVGAGESKKLQLEEKGTPQIDENGLLTIIRDSLPADERVKEPEVGTLKPAPVFDFGIVGTVQSSVLSAAAEEPAAMPVKLKSELSPSDAQHTIDACKVPPRQRTGFVGPPVESQLWTEKYKPTQSAHLVGNYNSVSKFGKWVAQSWKPGMPPPKVRSVLLSGPPGIGKTSACHVILKEVGFDVVEFNASDVRSKTSVQAQIESMTQNRSMGEFFQAANLSTKRVALIMDEVDGMSSGDRGGMQELIKIIQMTQIPIVCCCNDDGHQKVRALKKYCLCLPFQRPQPEMVLNRIMDVAKKEGMDLGLEACRQLFEGCNGDLRQMITNLQMWKNDKGDLNGTMTERLKSQHKEVLQVSIFENVGRIMGPGPTLADRMEYFFNDMDMTPIWIHEAWPKQAFNQNCPLIDALNNMATVAESISDSDLISQKIRGEQNWSLLPLLALTSSAKPGVILKGAHLPQLGFPQLLGQISKGNKRQRILRELNMHASATLSGGATAIRLDYFELLRHRLTQPLREAGADGVRAIIGLLEDLNLSKDDWDTLVSEFGLGPERLDKTIDTRAKSALTRMYNKNHKETTKLKRSKGSEGTSNSLRGGDDDNERGDSDLDDDNSESLDTLIKKRRTKKYTPAASNAKAKKKGSTSGPQAKKKKSGVGMANFLGKSSSAKSLECGTSEMQSCGTTKGGYI